MTTVDSRDPDVRRWAHPGAERSVVAPAYPDNDHRTGRSVGARLVVAVLAAGLLALTLACLHRLGDGLLAAPPIGDREALRTWVEERDAVTIAFALLRLLAMGAAWYLVGVTALGALARLSRIPGLVKWADMATLPQVRRLLTGTFGLAAALGSIAVIPTVTEPDPRGHGRPRGTEVVMRSAEGTAVVMHVGADDDEHIATMRLLEPGSDEASTEVQSASEKAAWTVAPGDSLWSLAAGHLALHWGRPPSDQEVHRYWLHVVDQNRTRLVEPGNPELIYAGQVFEAPPTGPSAASTPSAAPEPPSAGHRSP